MVGPGPTRWPQRAVSGDREATFDVPRDAAPPAVGDGTGMTPSIHTTRIVVADDSEVLLELMAIAVREVRGLYLVGAAEDGAEAVRLVVEESAEVALLDTDMPGLDGFEAAAEILRRRPRTQVVLHGHRTNDIDRARGRRLGVEVLSKLELLQTIEQLARHSFASLPSAA